MMFICYVETWDCNVPHMEPLPADTLDEARLCARRLLQDQDRSLAAHIFRDDVRLDTLVP